MYVAPWLSTVLSWSVASLVLQVRPLGGAYQFHTIVAVDQLPRELSWGVGIARSPQLWVKCRSGLQVADTFLRCYIARIATRGVGREQVLRREG